MCPLTSTRCDGACQARAAAGIAAKPVWSMPSSVRIISAWKIGGYRSRRRKPRCSHACHTRDVFDLAHRLVVMKNGQVVGTAHTADVTKDEVLGMIIIGKVPPGATPGPGALRV
jgi:hypothetical protein